MSKGWIGKVLPGFKQASNLPMDLQDGKALYFNDPFYGEKTLQIFKGYYSYKSTENDDFTTWGVGIDPAFSIDGDSVVIKVTYNNEETVCIIKGSDLRVRETYYIAEHKMHRWKALETPPVTVDSKTIAHYYNGWLYILKPVLDSSYSQNVIWTLDLTDPTAHWDGLSIQVTHPDSSEVSQILYGSCGSECYYVICPSYGDNIHECKLYSFNNGYIGDFINLSGNRNNNEPYSFLPPTDESVLAYVFREVKTRVWEDDEPIDEDIPKCQALNVNTLAVSYPSDKNPLPYDPSNAVPVYVDDYIHLLGGNSTNSSIRNHYGEGFATPMPIKNAWTKDLTLLSDGKAKRVVRGWIGDSENKPKEVLTPNFLTELSVDTSYEDASIAEFHCILRHDNKLYAFGKENSGDTELKLYEWVSSGWNYLNNISLSSCGYVQEAVSFNGFIYILTYIEGVSISSWGVYKIDLDLEEVTQIGETNFGLSPSVFPSIDFSKARFLVWKDNLYVTSGRPNLNIIYKLIKPVDDVYRWVDVTYLEFGLSNSLEIAFFFIFEGELHRLSNVAAQDGFHTSKFNPITKEWTWTDYDGGELIISELSSSMQSARFRICNYDGTAYAILQNQIPWNTGLPAPYDTSIKIYVYRYEPLGSGFNYMCWRKVQEVKTNSHYTGTSFDFVGDAAVFNGLINVITGSYWSYGFSFQDDIYQLEFTLIPPTT